MVILAENRADNAHNKADYAESQTENQTERKGASFLPNQTEPVDIYMDSAASTRVSDGVLAAMMPYFQECFNNASSVGTKASRAMSAITNARLIIARALNAKHDEIYFTSGGTESDNWALKSVAFSQAAHGKHIITTAIEHHAVLHTCEYLARQGFEITKIEPDEYGLISPDEIERAIRPDTILISVMSANNEIGTVLPLKELGKIARAHGVLFHTDAVQAFGHMPIDVEECNIDLLSASGHKLNGPKGIGFLYVRKHALTEPFMHGGSQEWGLRAGTLNTPNIAGLGQAAREAMENYDTRSAKTKFLRDRLIDGLIRSVPKIRLTGHPELRLDGNASFIIDGIDGHSLVILLANKGIYASAGSACTAGSEAPSHVLTAIGLDKEEAKGALRLSLSHENTEAEVDYVINEVANIVLRLRQILAKTV